MLDSFEVGEDVNISFNVRGNEWQEKYYVNLQAWKISKEAVASTQSAAPAPAANNNASEEDDLPF